MKDATGELSMTAIAVVAIAAVAAIFTIFVYPRIRSTIVGSTKCQGAVCTNCNGQTCECQWYGDDGTLSEDTITCPDPAAQNGNADFGN